MFVQVPCFSGPWIFSAFDWEILMRYTISSPKWTTPTRDKIDVTANKGRLITTGFVIFTKLVNFESSNHLFGAWWTWGQSFNGNSTKNTQLWSNSKQAKRQGTIGQKFDLASFLSCPYWLRIRIKKYFVLEDPWKVLTYNFSSGSTGPPKTMSVMEWKAVI